MGYFFAGAIVFCAGILLGITIMQTAYNQVSKEKDI